MNVYKDCKMFGPYTSKQDGRLRIVLVHPDSRKQTISYPKYLVEVYLNRYLDKEETVDHIDCNFLNNDLSNLRIIKRSDHIKQDRNRIRDVTISCNWCGEIFVISGSKLHQRNRRESSGFCSKSCSGKYGTYKQKTGNTFNKVKFDKVIYKQKSDIDVKSILEEQNIGEGLTVKADANTEA